MYHDSLMDFSSAIMYALAQFSLPVEGNRLQSLLNTEKNTFNDLIVLN